MSDANLMSASDAREALAGGAISAVEMVMACLGRIDELEDEIGAWAHLDREHALEQARRLDAWRTKGLALGPLHGLPVGIKDIIDTADFPTERGTELHAGRKSEQDATLVSLLREAGAIILGKTVTTELAVYAPGKTRNPHNPEHTPGGSSSGSAAAVSCAMVPLAVGTQTNGSLIRPASFCGVYAYKPSFGRISRHGVLQQSKPLDTMGAFGRSLNDLALIADVLIAYDNRDESMRPLPKPQIERTLGEEPPANPHFAFLRTPKWDEVDANTKDGFRELIEFVNEKHQGSIDIIDLPPTFEQLYEDHRIVMEADLARSFADEYERGRDKLSDVLVEMIERGRKVSDDEYRAALDKRENYREILDEILEEYDGVLTPSTLGAAPRGLDSTGSPVMNTIWTFCGNPALNLPLLQDEQGMPIGVQAVGQVYDDARLFRACRWLLEVIDD